MRKYYEEINRVKGVAILLVLLGHSVIIGPINLMEVEWCSTMYKYIYMFHMPLFFVISGFLYSFNGDYNEYIRKKLRRLMFPYVIFGIIDLLVRQLFPEVVNGNNSIYYDIISIILYGGQYWFLYTLFIIFAIFPFIEKMFKNKNYTVIIILVLFIMRFISITDLFRINTIIVYIFYFIVGYILKQNKRVNLIDKVNKNNKIIILSIIFIILGIINVNPLTEVIAALIGSLVTYNIVIIISNNGINKFLEMCGEYSLQFYLLNGFMLVPIRIIVVKILGISNPLIIIIVIFTLNIVLGLVIIKYIIFKVDLFRVMCGIKRRIS